MARRAASSQAPAVARVVRVAAWVAAKGSAALPRMAKARAVALAVRAEAPMVRRVALVVRVKAGARVLVVVSRVAAMAVPVPPGPVRRRVARGADRARAVETPRQRPRVNPS